MINLSNSSSNTHKFTPNGPLVPSNLLHCEQNRILYSNGEFDVYLFLRVDNKNIRLLHAQHHLIDKRLSKKHNPDHMT
jgi:hypothetical protein